MQSPQLTPVHLAANQPPDRFYRGGERLADFRHGAPTRRMPASWRVPEDWIASCTTLWDEEELGLTRLPDGTLLSQAVRADPVGWLGSRHLDRFGDDVALLVKLLDAGERLPVHVHPDVPFASEHLGLAHGKTEAWIVLEPAEVGLGFNREVSQSELERWVSEQDVSAMLAALHHIPVERGDAVLVPAGTPHAIGAGALVIELQEPTDLSILLEWRDFAIDGARLGHLGLGFPRALEAVDRQGHPREWAESLVQSGGTARGALLPAGAAFFRADRLGGGDGWEPSFAVVVVTAGAGSLRRADHGRAGQDQVAITAGDTVLIPAAWGTVQIEGEAEVVLCRPPAP